MSTPPPQKKSVAIIGCGVAGLSTFLTLRRSSTLHDVHVFDASDDPLAWTEDVTFPLATPSSNKTCSFSKSLALYDPDRSLHFNALLKAVGLHGSVSTPFSLSSSGKYRDGTERWHHVFGPLGTMVRELASAGCVVGLLSLPETCLLFAEIARFNLTARDVLRESKNGSDVSTDSSSQEVDDDNDRRHPTNLHEYLQANNFTEAFQERYLLPLVYALWNLTHREDALALPVAHVVHRLWGMRLLQMPFSWPTWVHPTASLGDSRDRGCSFPADGFLKNEKQIHRNCRVTAIQRDEVSRKYRLLAEEHGREVAFPLAGTGDGFDHVVIATPGDVAREILRDLPTGEEDEVLSAFRSERVVAVVQRASCRNCNPRHLSPPTTAINCVTTTPEHRGSSFERQPQQKQRDNIALSYTFLAHPKELKSKSHSFISASSITSLFTTTTSPSGATVTLNPSHPPDPSTIITLWEFQRPRLTRETIFAQGSLRKLQGARGLWLAGAWTGTGEAGVFEDAARSGVETARAIVGAEVMGMGSRGKGKGEEGQGDVQEMPPERGMVELGLRVVLAAALPLLQIFSLTAMLCCLVFPSLKSTSQRAGTSDEILEGSLEGKVGRRKGSHGSLSLSMSMSSGDEEELDSTGLTSICRPREAGRPGEGEVEGDGDGGVQEKEKLATFAFP